MYTYAHSSLNLCNLYLILFLPQNNSDGEFSDGLDEFEESREDSPEKKKVNSTETYFGFTFSLLCLCMHEVC